MFSMITWLLFFVIVFLTWVSTQNLFGLLVTGRGGAWWKGGTVKQILHWDPDWGFDAKWQKHVCSGKKTKRQQKQCTKDTVCSSSTQKMHQSEAKFAKFSKCRSRMTTVTDKVKSNRAKQCVLWEPNNEFLEVNKGCSQTPPLITFNAWTRSVSTQSSWRRPSQKLLCLSK